MQGPLNSQEQFDSRGALFTIQIEPFQQTLGLVEGLGQFSEPSRLRRGRGYFRYAAHIRPRSGR